MLIQVKNVTQARIDYVRKTYSAEFSRQVEGTYQKYHLSEEEIQQKISEQVGDRQFLEASYEPLKMKLGGEWSPATQTLTIMIGGGDNWGEEEVECKTLAYAERLMARKVAELAPSVEANL